MLQMAWPTVPLYHPDSYALRVLGDVLTDGKSASFYEVLVEEQEVAPGVFAGNQSSELAGRFNLQVRAYAGTDLDAVRSAIDDAFDAASFASSPPPHPATTASIVASGASRALSRMGIAFLLARTVVSACAVTWRVYATPDRAA